MLRRFLPLHIGLSLLLFGAVVFSFIQIVFATTPNPGHAWADVGDGVFAVTGPSALRTFTFPDANATVLTSNNLVTVGQGGTGAGTFSANAVLLGNGANTFQVVAPESANNVLTSNGSTWSSVAPPTVKTLQTRSYNATGATTALAINSLTTFSVGMFQISGMITVNQLSFNVSTVTTAGTTKVCVYSESGSSKLIDVTSGLIVAGANSITVGSIVLTPGNYYLAVGCATTCNDAVSAFTSTAVAMENGASVPVGKLKYEGTAVMVSGTCNGTLPAITAAASRTVNVRLDN
ncbi:hypothetical protein EXS71_03950 [Candidatus Uhrbacteria bacterium]|nr:hypothetical protein [Candidatus Uhrbacteria bacterium]